MIIPEAYRGKTVGVFGLARSGLASVAALDAAGAIVLADDDDPQRRLASPVPAHDLKATDFKSLDALVLAPGVPLTHPAPHRLVLKARVAGVPVIGDIELFSAARSTLPAHHVVAITGTNGKSTITALIAHMVRENGLPAVAAGNIGLPVLAREPLPEGGVYVLELSSYQIDLTSSLDADIAVLSNITPDHLERHGDMAGYVAAKRRLFAMQGKDRLAIIGIDDAHGRAIADSLPQGTLRVSVTQPLADGLHVDDAGMLREYRKGKARAIGSLDGMPALTGRHNWQNAALAFAAGRALGLDEAGILASFARFPGLAHRCEPVLMRSGVRYVNDSKATNPEAAATALAAFRAIRWIAGGRAKSKDLSALMPLLGNVRKAYLIGESSPLFADALAGRVPFEACGTIELAVGRAAAEAEAGDTVLLSPAAASFDQFSDFEARGEAFRTAVLGLDAGDRA
ncbi:MAG: UDP-N-acetylmuramoyl-L-alanine--D-glutamate ligase [Rhodothalassiaceae bacterium]